MATEQKVALSFYDHHRQNYGHLPIKEAAEFMVGGYSDGVDERGEFKITLIELRPHGREGPLHPHLEVFGDGLGAMKEAFDMGLESALVETYATRDEFTAALTGIGLCDRSDHPIGHKPVCNCCGQPVRR